VLAHFREAAIVGIVDEFEEELAGRVVGGKVERGAVVGNPVCACGEKGRVVGGRTNGEHAAAGGFA